MLARSPMRMSDDAAPTNAAPLMAANPVTAILPISVNCEPTSLMLDCKSFICDEAMSLSLTMISSSAVAMITVSVLLPCARIPAAGCALRTLP